MEKEFFSTPDLSLATTLIYLKFMLVKIDYQVEGERRKPRGYFNFENSDSLQEAHGKYWQDKISVEPKAYETCRKGLLARVNNTYKSPTSKYSRSF